jgi:hypothetical protein
VTRRRESLFVTVVSESRVASPSKLIFDLSDHHGNHFLVATTNRKNVRIEHAPLTTSGDKVTNCLTEVMIQKAQTWVMDWDNRCNKRRYSRRDDRQLELEGHHGRERLDSRRVSGIPVLFPWSPFRRMPRLSGSCATPVPIRSSRPMFQLLFFSFESASDVWGGSTSPYSDEHTPGGSTGGESAP